MRALVIIFLSGSLLLAGCSRDKAESNSKNGESNGAVSRINTPTQIKPLIEDEDSKAQPGHTVFFNDVRIEPGPTEKIVYAVGPNGGKMLVVLREPLKVSQDTEARFDVKGAVERAPSTRTMRKQWKMKKEEAAEVQKIGVYVESETVSAAGE